MEFGAWPIVAYRAPHPGGPWSGPYPILDPPENHTGSRYAYNPTMLHLAGDTYPLAYNVNAPFVDVLTDPDHSISRPRFGRVRISTQPP